MNRRYFVLIFFLILSTIGFAQPGGGGDPGPGQPVPIAGVEYLLLVGAGLGIKKWLNRNKGE